MTVETLDVRDIEPSERHGTIHDRFERLAPGDALKIVNDHEPKPLFYEMREEVETFDADGYEVEERAPDEFTAIFPKAEDD